MAFGLCGHQSVDTGQGVGDAGLHRGQRAQKIACFTVTGDGDVVVQLAAGDGLGDADGPAYGWCDEAREQQGDRKRACQRYCDDRVGFIDRGGDQRIDVAAIAEAVAGEGFDRVFKLRLDLRSRGPSDGGGMGLCQVGDGLRKVFGSATAGRRHCAILGDFQITQHFVDAVRRQGTAVGAGDQSGKSDLCRSQVTDAHERFVIDSQGEAGEFPLLILRVETD